MADQIWRLCVRVSENEDGTGVDRFYVQNDIYTSLEKAKTAADAYAKLADGQPWMREIRIYRVSADGAEEVIQA